MMRRHALGLMIGLLVAAHLPAAERFAITDEFVAYVKVAANPKELGLRDGRFYPYSTPLGRRIAWRQRVTDKAWFTEGLAQSEAERLLRADLERALADARQLAAARRPPVSFDGLPAASQEMLVDFVHSEGPENVPAALIAAVVAGDWRTLIERHLYVRWQGPSPDMSRNKAFADRWIYSEKLVPLQKPTAHPTSHLSQKDCGRGAPALYYCAEGVRDQVLCHF